MPLSFQVNLVRLLSRNESSLAEEGVGVMYMFMVLNYALGNLPALAAHRVLPSRNCSVCPVSKSLGVTLLSPLSLTGLSSSTAWVSMPSAASPTALPSSGSDQTNVAQSLLSWGCHANNPRSVTTHEMVLPLSVQGLCSCPSSSGSKQLRIPQNHFAFFPPAFSAAQLQVRTGIQGL